MASRQSTVNHLLGQMAGAGAVQARKMFGEYGLYLDGRMFALVCDDRLFVKPTEAGRAHLGAVTEAPPYPNAKPHFLIAGERWDDGEWLARLARVTAAALPAPARRRAAGRA